MKVKQYFNCQRFPQSEDPAHAKKSNSPQSLSSTIPGNLSAAAIVEKAQLEASFHEGDKDKNTVSKTSLIDTLQATIPANLPLRSKPRVKTEEATGALPQHPSPKDHGQSQNLTSNEEENPCKEYGRIMTVHDSGRLGNQMSEYATLLAAAKLANYTPCLLYTSPSPRDRQKSRMPSSA